MEIDLSNKHIKLLKKIRKHAVIRTDKFDIEDIEYLRENGLVVACCVDKKDDFFYQPRLTEKGKAVLYERLHSNRRANIALVLSICAIVLSFLTAFTPFSDWSRELIEIFIRSLL